LAGIVGTAVFTTPAIRSGWYAERANPLLIEIRVISKDVTALPTQHWELRFQLRNRAKRKGGIFMDIIP